MSPEKRCILVVEDDADSFDWVRRRLAQYGYEVEWASTVGDGLAKLSLGPRGVILDLAMPDGSGADIIRAIRDRGLPIKVAVVSGADGIAMHAEAALLKPDAFFRKPVDAVELMSWIKSACP